MDIEDAYENREQSRVKHLILSKYLDRLAHKVGSWCDTLIYIDGFGGPWRILRYEDVDHTLNLPGRRLTNGEESSTGSYTSNSQIRHWHHLTYRI